MEESTSNEMTENEDYNPGPSKFLEYLSLATDYISIPLCIAAILVNILLIFVILKHKRLKRRHNYYLLNYAIFHSIYIISTPTLHLIVDIFYEGQIKMKWYCVFLRIENYAILQLLIFASGYSLDAFLDKRKDAYFNLYERHYKHIFVAVYLLGIIFYTVAATLCFLRDNENFNFYFLTTLFVLICFTELYAYWANKRSPIFQKDSFAINISLSVMICFFPLIVCYSFIHIFKDNHKVEFVLWYSAFAPEFLAYCSSMVVAYKIYKADKLFRVAFRKALRRTVQSSDYDELNTTDDIEAK